LFNMTGESSSSEQLRNQVLEFRDKLKTWKEKVSQKIRPGDDSQAVTGKRPLPVLMLHLAYYSCVDMADGIWAINRGPGKPHSGTLEQPSAAPSHSRLEPSALRRTEAARATLRLLERIKPLALTDIWRALSYLLCATITLLAEIVEHPGHGRAASDINLMGSFVRFLEIMQRRVGIDFGRFWTGCALFEKVAKSAVTGADDMLHGHIQTAIVDSGSSVSENKQGIALPRLQSLELRLSGSANYMDLAQGLMSDVPRLNAAACSVFGEIFGVLDNHGPPFCSFAPGSLRPSTYGFGPTPNQEAITRLAGDYAVYTDQDLRESR